MAQIGSDINLAVAYSPNGQAVLTGGNDGVVRLWDLTKAKLTRSFEGHSVTVTSLAFTPDGRRALSGSRDRTARLWDLETGRQVRVLDQHDDAVTVATIGSDGNLAMTGCRDGSLHIWDLRTGSHRKLPESHIPIVTSIAITPDGRRAVSSGFDRRILFWNLETLTPIRSMTALAFGSAITPDGRRLLTSHQSGEARIWDLETGANLRSLKGHKSLVTSVAVSADGLRALTGSWDRTARLWDIETGKQLLELSGHEGHVESVSFSADGTRGLTAGFDRRTRLWDLRSGKLLRAFTGLTNAVHDVAISPDGGKMLAGYSDGTAHLWDLRAGRPARRLEGHAGPVKAVAFTPDGRLALTGGDDGTALLWGLGSGDQVKRLEGHGDSVADIAVAVDGRRAVTASWDGTARLWDLETGASIATFAHGDDAAVEAVAISPDGGAMLTGGTDGTAQLWDLRGDLRSGRPTLRLKGHAGPVRAVAFTPDGRLALTGGGDRTARLWDLGSGNQVGLLEGHGNEVADVAVDGRRAVTASWDGTARLWDLETGATLATLTHGGVVDAVTIAPNRNRVFLGGWDGTTSLWDMEPAQKMEPARKVLSYLNLEDSSWAVFDEKGRFDAYPLETVGAGLQWIVKDDPFHPLNLEIFMRDYYEPKLLPRLLGGDTMRPIRPLESLNRIQPEIQISGIVPNGARDHVKVTVVATMPDSRPMDPNPGRPSGIFDLRLFRDGQLVGRWPKPTENDDALPEPDPTSATAMTAWRDANRVKPDGDRAVVGPDGRITISFPVRLPREPGRELEFTAYAFNDDRVKSATASATHEVPADVPKAAPRAYVVSFGASGFSDPAWDLHYADSDARAAAEGLGEALRLAGQYQVVPVVLATPRGGAGGPRHPVEAAATKGHLRAVFGRLAGGRVEADVRDAIPGYEMLEPATPDDLVLLFVSSHGYTDKARTFYVFPEDIGGPRDAGRTIDEGTERDRALLKACVSSGELSAWLRGVDAGQLAMVVDCCHSAATVEGREYKPGPMGSRGLGQLAYDKAMRVLAASAADDVALEARIEGKGYGLLTYALLHEGLEAGDGDLSLGSLLRSAEDRVPKLYAKIVGAADTGLEAIPGRARVLARRGAAMLPLAGAPAPQGSTLRRGDAFQTPALFDFARGRDAKLEKRNPRAKR